MKKSELRQIIKEEIKLIVEKYTYEYIGNKLIKAKQVKKGMPEKEMIKQIVILTKKEYGDKKGLYMVNRDEDYLPDVISYINDTLGR